MAAINVGSLLLLNEAETEQIERKECSDNAYNYATNYATNCTTNYAINSIVVLHPSATYYKYNIAQRTLISVLCNLSTQHTPGNVFYHAEYVTVRSYQYYHSCDYNYLPPAVK
jgi:hypothetical protein